MRTRLFADDFYKQAPLIDEPAPGNGTALRRSLHRAWTSQVLPTILRIFDRASMSASVESRAPFLDWRLVALVFSLPDDDIIRDGRTKWIQREAMRGSLPREVIERRGKNGFAMPLPLWFRSPAVTNALREALADGSIARADGLEVKRFEQLLDDEVRRGFTYSGSVALWQAYAYAQLRAVFADASIGRTA
jgi:asparagine synthase (glutamine-hydrolysing)